MRRWLTIAVLCISAHAGLCEDQVGAKWDELRPDSKISAQMLCLLGMEMFVQQIVEQCKLPKTPFDDASEHAIRRIEEFVVVNSSQHPQISTFAEMRRVIGDNFRKSPDHRVCNDPGFDKGFRSTEPAAMDASVEKMLISPFDPNQNGPCGP